jgi:hypothetical protein
MRSRASLAGGLLLFSVASAVMVWPTTWRVGWANHILNLQVEPFSGATGAASRWVMDLVVTWWGRLNDHPPASIGDWLGIFGVSGFAGLALLIVIGKALALMTLLAFAAGAAVGALATRLGTSINGWRLYSAMLLPLLRAIGRFWIIELLVVVAAIVALDAIAMALRTSF